MAVTGAGRLWVVVPAYNEEQWITPTLASLAAQRDRDFTLLVVDNASTDGTSATVRRFADAHPDLDLRLIREDQKGTGAACDTGMRHAIANGATLLARTDADCLAAPGWTAAARRAFQSGYEMVGGRLKARTDDFRVTIPERMLLASLFRIASFTASLRPSLNGPEYLGRAMLIAGGNSAITASLYERSGGYPRLAIEDDHEDRELMNRIRRITGAYGRCRDMVIYWSQRRTKAWGLWNTLSWYDNHGYRGAVVDVR